MNGVNEKTLVQHTKDRTFLVTGGTGSFGSTMVRYLLSKQVAKIKVLSRDEAKQDHMRHELGDPRVQFMIGDTRDPMSVARAMKGVDYVFHAAALKQVPSAEFFPLEAVKTNINGSSNVLHSALEEGVRAVVCLSTDKAVYPINAMGMSKALMEKTAQSFARDNLESPTRICVTRYGNVMFSRGSVIPLFLRQIRAKQAITVTEPTMTRFLMSLSESVELVQHAFINGESGDILVKKAPATTIGTLALALQNLLMTKVDIEQIGFRHGEKLYETLLSAEERAKAIDQGEFFRVPLDSRDMNYAEYFEEGKKLNPMVEPYTSHNAARLDMQAVMDLIKHMPEFKSEGLHV